MSLDLTKIAAQVGAMITGLKDGRAERERRLRYALEKVNNPSTSTL